MEKHIIEINGVKMEVDFRESTNIESFKVGDRVKVLVKSFSSWRDYVGCIIGFDEFKERPTIIVAYLNLSYGDAVLSFAYINKDTQDIEIIKACENDIPFQKADVLHMMDRDIMRKEEELRELHFKKNHFIQWFGEYFEKYENKEK